MAQPSKAATQHVQQLAQGQMSISRTQEVLQKQLQNEQQRRIDLEQMLAERLGSLLRCKLGCSK